MTKVLPFPSNNPLQGLNEKPGDYLDTTIQAMSERIADDYSAIIKALVVPELEQRTDLKLREIRILVCLQFYDEPISPSKIANIVKYDRATVTRSIRILEAADMVERIDNIFDQRSIQLVLTQKGQDLSNFYNNITLKVFTDLDAKLGGSLDGDSRVAQLTLLYKIGKRSKAMRREARILTAKSAK